MFANRKYWIGISLTALFVTGFFTACSYVTPEAENPVPGLESESTNCVNQDGVLSCKKSFFGIEPNLEKNEVTNSRKKWMCGWAPVEMGGQWKGGLTAAPYRSRHCNVEFRITKNGKFLEAREMNVDFMNNVNRWQQLFLIPITTHYFYEKEVDNRGRELNKYKKVTNRENWKVSPIMDLDLSNIVFTNKQKRPFGFWGATLTDVYDPEFTIEEGGRHFFGFTGTAIENMWGSHIQHEMRFNFYEIKDNPSFTKTAYNIRNSRFMNILHILGSSPDGWNQIQWAAHWGVKDKPIEFCLNGFPDDYRNYKDIGRDVLKEMNTTMEKIGAVEKGKKAFVESKRKFKYMFDLRCPAITWVDDPHLAFSAPLGIGLVNTNIQTGEILWGNAIVWGGLIDYIVNRDIESPSDALARGTHEYVKGLQSNKHNPYFEDVESHLDLTSIANKRGRFKTLAPLIDQYKDESIIESLKKMAADKEILVNKLPGETQEEIDAKIEVEKYLTSVEAMVQTQEFRNIKRSDLRQKDRLVDVMGEAEGFLTQYESESQYTHSMHSKMQESQIGLPAQFNDEEKEKQKIAASGFVSTEIYDKMAFDHFSNRVQAVDADNSVDNYYETWMAATHKMGDQEKLAAAKSVIKNVMLHEFGHIVGMGHQFEGNRLPEKGTLPDTIHNELVTAAEKHENYTSIMDYMSGHTEVALDYDKVKLQIQDELVLRYLYNQQVATYRPGDNQYNFDFKVPVDGTILEQFTDRNSGKVYKTSYLPQCSDVEAWKAVSPYCRRWDRGFDAQSIVRENFGEYTDSFISRMNSFTEATGGKPWMASYRLWNSTYNLMNHNRTFYDHLRFTMNDNRRYHDVTEKFKAVEQGLIEFSKACVDPSLASSEELRKDFATLSLKPVIKDIHDINGPAYRTNVDYDSLLSSFESARNEFVERVESRQLIDLRGKDWLDFERNLNERGVALTEVNKLCRAAKLSLNYTKVLLSLNGPDYSIRNYNEAIVPTGLRGANATTDYSRVFGTYEQVGLLPLKVAAMDVLTSLSSTMRWGWWRVGKPRFMDPNDGKFGYFAFYPEEFTDIVGTAVKTNMGFGDDGLRNSATLSISNLYMPYFLYRTFSLSGDKQTRGFEKSFLEKLQAQTRFDVDISAVILEPVKVEGEDPDERFGFNPKLYVFGSNDMYDLPEAYLLKSREVIIRPNKNQIIMPISKIRFINAETAYAWAINVTYDKASYDDEFQGFSVKNAITESTDHELNKCISHPSHGLDKFFKQGKFDGFIISSNIATDRGAQTQFEVSVDTQFDKFNTQFGLQGEACSEQAKGIGLVTSTALSLDGFILRQVYDYIQ